MLWNLNSIWLFMTVFTVGAISFILSIALDKVMGDDGFGAWGNTAIIVGGFFMAILGFNLYGTRLSDLQVATAVGLARAFVALGTMAILKAALLRL